MAKRGAAGGTARAPRPRAGAGALPAWAALGLVLLAAAWLQAGALRLPFFSDDYLFLDQARDASLPANLVAPDPIGNFVRPLGRQVWFWLILRAGASPLAAHAANLALLLAVLALLFVWVRRLTRSAAAGTIAAALLAVHYVGDVLVRWGSGSQDLLAVTGALGALLLFSSGRRAGAAVVLGLALLSKETVLFTPLVAVVADRRAGESWLRPLRRAWPLAAASAAWVVFWAFFVRGRASGATPPTPGALAATFAHLAQVVVGAEWRTADPAPWRRWAPPLIPILLTSAAVALVAARPARATEPEPARAPAHPVWAGVALAVAGALPVAFVVELWSAYQYLFALCGVALLLGAALERAPRAWAVAALVVLALGSENGRRLDAVSDTRDPWNPQSHVSRFYVDRALEKTRSYLAQLKALHPTLPPHSTLFFNKVPAYVAWQFGDGPLVRWAYADRTLRSYFFGEFTLARAREGPVYVFSLEDPDLVETTADPNVFRDLGVSMLLGENEAGARDAFAFQLERRPGDRVARAASAWLALAAGDTSRARRALLSLGWSPDRGPAGRLDAARALARGGHAAAAESLVGLEIARHALDPESHALRADLVERLRPGDGDWIVERFAARVLGPGAPGPWRAWAWTQWRWGHYERAERSLRRYFELAGPAGAQDQEALALEAEFARVLPGGDLAQRALRER